MTNNTQIKKDIPTYFADGYSKINLSPSITKVEFVLIDNDEDGKEIKTPTFTIALSTDALIDLSRKLIEAVSGNREEFEKAIEAQKNRILNK